MAKLESRALEIGVLNLEIYKSVLTCEISALRGIPRVLSSTFSTVLTRYLFVTG